MELAARIALLSSHVDQSRLDVDASLAGLQWAMHVLAREIHRGDDLVGFFHRGQGESVALVLNSRSLQSSCELSLGVIREVEEMAAEGPDKPRPRLRYDYSQEEMRALTEKMRKAYEVIHHCQDEYLRLVGIEPLPNRLAPTGGENKIKQ